MGKNNENGVHFYLRLTSQGVDLLAKIIIDSESS